MSPFRSTQSSKSLLIHLTNANLKIYSPAEKAEPGLVELGPPPLEIADIGNDAEFFPAHILSDVYRSNKKVFVL